MYLRVEALMPNRMNTMIGSWRTCWKHGGLDGEGCETTEWCPGVQLLPDTRPIPGVHFRVIEATSDHPDFAVFPDIPQLRDSFRHAWLMTRNRVPRVPAPANTPMPERAASRAERARLFSVYLRP